MSVPGGVLAVMELAQRGSQYSLELLEARAALVELVKLTREVADEHTGIVASIKYETEYDEVGSRVCCDVLSYEDHAEDCPAVKLRALLTKFGDVK